MNPGDDGYAYLMHLKERAEAKPSLAAKIRQLRKYGNEIAIGYDDSGCFWILHYGRRGAGAMIEGCGLKLRSDEDDFEKAVDEFLAELLRLHGPRE